MILVRNRKDPKYAELINELETDIEGWLNWLQNNCATVCLLTKMAFCIGKQNYQKK
jgi:hypothetical protein